MLVGLSVEESQRYAALFVQREAGDLPADVLAEFRGLDQKHQLAWATRVMAQPRINPDVDYNKQWEDRDGTRLMVGLTAEETDAALRLGARELAYRRSDFIPRPSDDERAWLEQLTNKARTACLLQQYPPAAPQPGLIQRLLGRNDARPPKKAGQ